jgi:hypothetical protein
MLALIPEMLPQWYFSSFVGSFFALRAKKEPTKGKKSVVCIRPKSILSKKRAKIKRLIQKRKQILSIRLTFRSRYVNIS